MRTIRRAAIVALLLIAPLLAQFPVPGTGGGGGGGGAGAPNPTASSTPAVTSLAIDISSLGVSNVGSVLVQCWSGTAAPYSPVTVTSLNPASTSSVTANFSSTANVTCRANSAGSAGAQGPTGPAGPAGSGAAYSSVSYSATPTFAVTTSTAHGFALTLAGNVSSSTLSAGSATAGQSIWFRICQDAIGSRTFVWPATVTGGATISSSANACSVQQFVWNGSAAVAAGSMTVEGGTPQVCIAGSSTGEGCVQAPATGGGTATLPAGSGTLLYATGNAATATALAANPAACTPGQYVTDIAADGTLTCGTPAGGSTSIVIQEDFIGNPSGQCAANQYMGSIGFRSVFFGPNLEAPVCSDVVAGHPGILKQVTGASSGDDASLALATFKLDIADSWKVRYLIQLPDATSVAARVGLWSTWGADHVSYIYVEKETGDTSWYGSTHDGSTESRTAALATVDTNWLAVQIRRVNATTVGFKTASTLSGLDAATEVTKTTNLPTGGMYPAYVKVATATASTRSIRLDYYSFELTSTR